MPSLSSGYGYGSLMWIPLETAFVNPDNILPLGAECLAPNATREDCEDDTPKYFTDEDLLARFYLAHSRKFQTHPLARLGFRTVSF